MPPSLLFCGLMTNPFRLYIHWAIYRDGVHTEPPTPDGAEASGRLCELRSLRVEALPHGGQAQGVPRRAAHRRTHCAVPGDEPATRATTSTAFTPGNAWCRTSRPTPPRRLFLPTTSLGGSFESTAARPLASSSLSASANTHTSATTSPKPRRPVRRRQPRCCDPGQDASG